MKSFIHDVYQSISRWHHIWQGMDKKFTRWNFFFKVVTGVKHTEQVDFQVENLHQVICLVLVVFKGYFINFQLIFFIFSYGEEHFKKINQASVHLFTWHAAIFTLTICMVKKASSCTTANMNEAFELNIVSRSSNYVVKHITMCMWYHCRKANSILLNLCFL